MLELFLSGALECFILLQVGKRCAFLLLLVIPTLFIDRQESGEPHRLMICPEHVSCRCHVNGQRIVYRIGHLRSHKTAPDQPVELILFRRETAADGVRIQIHIAGPDRFMGVLGGVLCLVAPGRRIVIPAVPV